MVSKLNILAVLLFIGSFQISDVFGIYCFQCNSLHDPECETIMPNDTSSVFYRPCQYNEDANGAEMFCRKIVQTIYDRDGMVRVIRSCGWIQHKRECYVVSNKGHQEIACQCFSDGCNSATKTVYSVILPIISLFFFINFRL